MKVEPHPGLIPARVILHTPHAEAREAPIPESLPADPDTRRCQ